MALASKKHNYIFIHIYKCGGNSIRNMLGTPSMGFPGDYPTGTREIHGVHTNIADVKAHLTAMQDLTFYNAAFKFSVVRNPYSHLVSLYRYMRHSTIHQYHNLMKSKNFYQFLNWFVQDAMPMERPYGANKYQLQSDFLRIDGHNEMDFVARLEAIDYDIRTICAALAIPETKVPKINRFDDKKRIPWQEYYDDQCKEFVDIHFLKDFTLFNYPQEIK